MQQQLYSNVMNNTTLQNSSTILNDFVNYPPNDGLVFNAYTGYALSWGGANEAFSVLNLWQPQTKADLNYYKYYTWQAGLKLGMKMQPQDMKDLRAMAEGCPFTDGAVVFWARNLHNRLTNKHEMFKNSCWVGEMPSERKEKPVIAAIEDKLFDIKVYPNPTFGLVNIILPSKGNWQITTLDLSGRVVWQQSCTGYEGTIQHRLEGSKGMYFIKITNTTNGQQTVQKIILQ